MTEIEIYSEYIHLASDYVPAHFAGEVMVNGAVCTQRGKKLRDGDRVTLGPEEFGVKQA